MNNENLFERNIRWSLNAVNACMNSEAYVGAMREMCCIIDGLSGYYTGSKIDKGRKIEGDFIAFIERYFSEFNRFAQGKNGSEYKIKMKPYRDKNSKLSPMSYYEILYSQFRCGLVHNLLMKPTNAIYRGRNNPYFNKTKAIKLIINVHHFYDDFTRAILTYKDDVLANKDRLKDNYKKRYKFLTGKTLNI